MMVSGNGDTGIPPLTERSKARLAAGATEGAGTDTCTKCAGAKEPRRINSDKCRECNTPATAKTPRPRAAKPEVTKAIRWEPPPGMYAALQAEARKRDMTMNEYLTSGMRRVLKKDAGWVAPPLTEMFPETEEGKT